MLDIKLTPKHRGRFRCFISAPFGCNVEGVIAALSKSGVESRRLDSLKSGSSITKTLAREIGRSDFLCAVLPTEMGSASMYYEVGVAVGAGLPVMILAETTAEIPFDISQLPVGRISLNEPTTIDLAVRAMLQRLKPAISKSTVAHDSPIGSGAPERRAPPVSRSKERDQVYDLTQATQRLNAIRTHGSSGSEFEQFMASLFAEAGFLVSAASTKDDRGVDLTLWLDEIAPVFKNPVLVELKTDLSRHGIWSHAADQLRRYLHTAGATCGVLVSLN